MRNKATLSAATGVATTLILLAGCASAETPPIDTPGGGGLPAGSLKEEWIAAFEDIEPMELVTQVSGPDGSYIGAKESVYLDAITEWSGGKITFDRYYANSIAPPGEEDNALAEGRVDLAMTTPAIEPARYPAFSAFNSLTVLVDEQHALAAPMHMLSYMQEVGYEIPEIFEEYRSAGMQLLLPSVSFVPQVVTCTSSKPALEDWQGALVASTSAAVGGVLEALGAVPTSLAFTETYEGLQRNAIDCTTGSLPLAATTGVAEIAPWAMKSNGAPFPAAGGGYAMSADVWDSLPLVVRQLFHDRMSVFIEQLVRDLLEASAATVATVEAQGGAVVFVDQAATEAMITQNDRSLVLVGESEAIAGNADLVERSKDIAARWIDRIVTDVPEVAEVSFADLPGWWDDNGAGWDLQPYVDAVDEMLALHRPAN